jgi:hypothetical protein
MPHSEWKGQSEPAEDYRELKNNLHALPSTSAVTGWATSNDFQPFLAAGALKTAPGQLSQATLARPSNRKAI